MRLDTKVAPSLKGALAPITLFLKTRSRTMLVFSTSNCAPERSRLAERESLSWKSATEVAIPNNNVNGMRSDQELLLLVIFRLGLFDGCYGPEKLD